MIYIKRFKEIEARCVCEIKSMQCIKDERKIKREVRDEIETYCSAKIREYDDNKEADG